MNTLLILLTVLLWTVHQRSRVTVSAQDPNERVNCYANEDCGGTPSGVGVTREACCSNLLDPVGFSVQTDVEGCERCPIVVGFSPDNFTGMEGGEGHPVTAGYLSGRPRTGGSLNLQLITGSEATDEDVRIDTRVRVFNSLPLSTIMITLVLDGVSQEIREKFSIEYFELPLNDANFFPVGVPVTVGHLNGTILDQDSINFQLAEDEYFQQEEPNAMMEILILKDQGIRLANPVRFRITPLTVPEAEARGIIADFSLPGIADTPISPIRADTNDFNATAFEVTLRSDEDLPVGDTTVFIPIVDDEIDEAQSQFFIVYLEILDAVNLDLITISRTISTCIIDDNDGTRIGFAEPVYAYPEPDFETLIREVTLIREGGGLSEQTFSVAISVGDPGGTTRSATLERDDPLNADYGIGSLSNFIILPFPAVAQSITFNFFLQVDELPEGLEAFRVASTPSIESPTFQPPQFGGAFQFTEIQIFDNDFVVVGFERPSYNISESGSQEVCVEVFIPSQDEELVLNIFLVYYTRPRSSERRFGGLLAFIASLPNGLRRQCLDIFVIDDELRPSFTLILELDNFELQAGITVQPNTTEIFIVNSDVGDGANVNVNVTCYLNENCDCSVREQIPLEECCNNMMMPPGFSYRIAGQGECTVCPIVFGFTQTTLTGFEQEDMYRVLAGFLSGRPASSRGQVIDLTLEFDTANSNDVFLRTTQITPIRNQLLQEVMFRLVTDNVAQEFDKNFSISIDISSGQDILFSNVTTFLETINVTIMDADRFDLYLVGDEFQMREQFNTEVIISKDTITMDRNFSLITLANPISLRITPLTVNAALAGNIIDTFQDEDFNKAGSDDFDETRLIVEYPADEEGIRFPQITVSIPIMDDDIDEADQLFVVRMEIIGAVNVSLIDIGLDVSYCRIIDNDDITIGFSQPLYQFPEPEFFDAVANLTLVKNRQSERTFEVVVVLSDSLMIRTATLGDENNFDYRVNGTLPTGPLTINLTFPPNLQNLSFSFILNSDDEVEGMEGFQASIMPSGAFLTPRSGQVYLNTTSVQIIDNDFAVVGFEQPSYTITESEGPHEVCVRVFNPSEGEELPYDIFMLYETMILNGSADEGDISEVGLQRIQISANSSRRACFHIVVIDDEFNERAESFFVMLILDSMRQQQRGVIIQPNITEIVIEDDDALRFGFDSESYTVNETAGVIQVPVVVTGEDREFIFNVTVNGSIESGSASGNADYRAERYFQLVYSNNVRTNLISISIVDDEFSELQENFTLILDELVFPDNDSSTSEDKNRLIFAIKRAVVFIQDEDVITIGFMESTNNVTVGEGAGEISFTLGILSGILQYNLSIDVETTAMSALNGSDYISPTQTFLFNNANQTQTFILSIMDDFFLEDNETFSIAMTLPLDSENVVLIVSAIDVTINDNDQVVVGFSTMQDVVVASESDEAVQLVVGVVEGYLGVTVNISFNTIPQTAQANEDYLSNSSSLCLTGNETQTISVSLMDNQIVDGNRTFEVQLMKNAQYPNLMLSEAATVVILDDDVEIGFFENEITVSEGSGVVVLVVGMLAGTLEGMVNISFRINPGTAEADIDYNSTSGDLTFIGNQNHTINVSIIDDQEADEGNERFMADISLTSVDPRVQLKNPTITIVIVDNEETPSDLSNGVIIGIVSAIAFLVLLFFILAFIIYARRAKKAKAKNIASQDLDTDDKASDAHYELSSMRVRRTYRMNVPQGLIINSCNLQLNEPVGQGEFGIVYKARLSKGFNKSFSEVVAVKTLKGFLEHDLVRDLLKECTKMSILDHPNVLTLIGVCVDGGPAPYIIMPFMFNGSLLAHLKKERENLVLPPEQEMDSDTVAVSSKLMDMSLQVAKGMEYLASKRLIHRDLAARNCMIDMNFVIKVADFGLSESTEQYKDYFRQDKTEGVKLPVKWLAPECLSDGVFSEKSDVWAFGVTCWEIFSGGKVPYAGINPVDLPNMLESGYRMESPRNSACVNAMSELIGQCWAAKPEDRPTFCGIVVSFSLSLELISGYMDLSKEN